MEAAKRWQSGASVGGSTNPAASGSPDQSPSSSPSRSPCAFDPEGVAEFPDHGAPLISPTLRFRETGDDRVGQVRVRAKGARGREGKREGGGGFGGGGGGGAASAEEEAESVGGAGGNPAEPPLGVSAAKALELEDGFVEPLLREEESRYVVFPIKYPRIFEMYQKHDACFWSVGEVDLSADAKDWAKLRPEEKAFILNVLAFFAGSDGIVNENLLDNFTGEVKPIEAKMFYASQANIEFTHGLTYSLLINMFEPDPDRKLLLFNALEHNESIKKKAEWTKRWMCPERATFAERLVAFACVEGIYFSASFCAIFWLKKRGLMPGLGFTNELISRDEGLHCDFACLLYTEHVVRKLTQERVHAIVGHAVEVEENFVRCSLKADLIGMNADQMCQYVRFCADRLLSALGHEPMFFEENPFDWMELISLQGKTNFFEKRVGEYSKAFAGQVRTKPLSFEQTDDF